jgi:hypothetical protein
MESLEEIVFDCAIFSPEGTHTLGSFPRLKLIRMGAMTTNQSVEELQKALPKCEIRLESK